MLRTTRDLILPTAITGSYPRPLWYDASLNGRSFKVGPRRLHVPRAVPRRRRLRSSMRRRRPGSTSSPTATAASTWRSAASRGSSTRSSGWAASRATATPRAAGCSGTASARARSCGRCRRPTSRASCASRLTRGPLEYAALWKVAQRLSDRPVKFGAICAPALASMLWDEHYRDERALMLDLCDIMNAEFRELAAAGCPVIQVEEPRHHGRTHAARLHRRRPRLPHRGVQPPARRRRRRDLGAHLLGQPEPAARLLGGAELRARAALPLAARLPT